MQAHFFCLSNQSNIHKIHEACRSIFLDLNFRMKINFDKSAEIFIVLTTAWKKLSLNIVEFVRVIYSNMFDGMSNNLHFNVHRHVQCH